MSLVRPEDHPALPVLILAAVFLAFCGMVHGEAARVAREKENAEREVKL